MFGFQDVFQPLASRACSPGVWACHQAAHPNGVPSLIPQPMSSWRPSMQASGGQAYRLMLDPKS